MEYIFDTISIIPNTLFGYIFLFLISFDVSLYNETGNDLFKITFENIRLMCLMCSKSTIKVLVRPNWHHCGFLIVNFEHISRIISQVDFTYTPNYF